MKDAYSFLQFIMKDVNPFSPHVIKDGVLFTVTFINFVKNDLNLLV